MVSYDLHHSGCLVAVRHKNDQWERKADGLLKNPPSVYVLHYSYEHDRLELSPIDWRAAKAIAPVDMGGIEKSVDLARRAGPPPSVAKHNPGGVSWVERVHQSSVHDGCVFLNDDCRKCRPTEPIPESI